jgi:nucleotide-binding universal stress UspA family protein
MDSRGPGRVIVGVSNTLAGYEALRFAVEAARALRTSVIAVRAVKTSPAADVWPALRQTMHESAHAEVARAFDEALGGAPSDVDVSVVTESGAPHLVLPSIATRPDDLLVIGATHHHTPRMTGRWGVARYCTRFAGCPVVVVPARAMARSTRSVRPGHSVADDVEAFLRDHS